MPHSLKDFIDPANRKYEYGLLDTVGMPNVPQQSTGTVSYGAAGAANLWHGVFCPINETVYMTATAGNQVRTMKPWERLASVTINVGTGPRGIAYDPLSEKIFVCNNAAGVGTTVSVINPRLGTVAATISGVNKPYFAIYGPSTQYVYTIGGNITIIDGLSNTIAGTVALGVGSGPYRADYDPSTNAIFFSINTTLLFKFSLSNHTNSVYTPNGHTFEQPTGVCYCPSNGYLYVIDYRLSGEVWVVVCDTSNNQVAKTIVMPAGRPYLESLVYHPTKNQIYGFSSNQNVNAWTVVIDCNTNTVVNTLAPLLNDYRSSGLYIPTTDQMMAINYTNGTTTFIK